PCRAAPRAHRAAVPDRRGRPPHDDAGDAAGDRGRRCRRTGGRGAASAVGARGGDGGRRRGRPHDEGGGAMTAAIVVLVVGLGSYLFRISMVVLAGTERLWIRRATPFVVPAAFAALATGGIVTAVGGQPLGGMLPPLAAAAVAVA